MRVGKMSERRKQDRGLGRIQRQIFDTRRLRHMRGCELGLNFHVVQFRFAVLAGDQAQGIEVQEVGAFKISVAIAQSGSCHGPEVDRPEDKAYDKSVCPQAPGSEPARVLSSVCHGKRFMVMEGATVTAIKVAPGKVQAQECKVAAWATGYRRRVARRDGP